MRTARRTSSSQANRGQAWETFLISLHERYRIQRLAIIEKNHPEIAIKRKLGGTAIHGELRARAEPDFTGHSQGVSWYAEAKECASARWPFSDLRPLQAVSLDDAIVQQLGAFLFIKDTASMPNRAYIIPWWRIRDRWWSWRRNREQGITATPGTASINFVDLQELAIFDDLVIPGRWNYLRPLVEWMAIAGDEGTLERWATTLRSRPRSVPLKRR